MNRVWARYSEVGIGLLKYLIAIIMMLEGFETALTPISPMGGSLGFIYSTRPTLVAFGVIFFACGAALFYGKARRSKKWTGRGLMAIFLCAVFAAVLQLIAFSEPSYWLSNVVFALITGALWLRWKLKTNYIDPNHFNRDIDELTRP